MIATRSRSAELDIALESDPRSLLIARVMEEAERTFGSQVDNVELGALVESITDQYFENGEVKVTAFLPLLVMRELAETVPSALSVDHMSK